MKERLPYGLQLHQDNLIKRTTLVKDSHMTIITTSKDVGQLKHKKHDGFTKERVLEKLV